MAMSIDVVCWGDEARSVLGSPLDPMEVLCDRRMTARLPSLLQNTSHPTQDALSASDTADPSSCSSVHRRSLSL